MWASGLIWGYVAFVSFLVLNVVLAVVMDNFLWVVYLDSGPTTPKQASTAIVGLAELHNFLTVWKKHDVYSLGVVNDSLVAAILAEMEEPLGYSAEAQHEDPTFVDSVLVGLHSLPGRRYNSCALCHHVLRFSPPPHFLLSPSS